MTPSPFPRRHSPFLFLLCSGLAGAAPTAPAPAARPPNILIAISDDQSWAHTSAAGYSQVSTPGFDRVARAGVYFSNAICASPGCAPSRAALLTGAHPWMLAQAGTHASSFPARFATFPDILAKRGYATGFTGKGWGPGSWKAGGRTQNPAGPEFSSRKIKDRPSDAISGIDYAGNFAAFLDAKAKDQPFCFWFGAEEPHRRYDPGSGVRAGKDLQRIVVPAFLPDTPEVCSDIADYLLEIEWFDAHLVRMLALLEERGELQNTIVLVMSDNGMPFPRAKANAVEYGIHVPLAISWPARVPAGQTFAGVVPLVDVTASLLEATGAPSAAPGLVGRSLWPQLTAAHAAPAPRLAYISRERHSSSRPDNLGYPQRAVRSDRHLFIRNLHSERWPAGDPQKYEEDGRLGPSHGAYHDIDAGPTLTYLTAHATDPVIGPFLQWSVAKRPAEELYDIVADPACLKNLAADPAFAGVRAELGAALAAEMRRTGDPRAGDNPEIWETYERYEGKMRRFPTVP